MEQKQTIPQDIIDAANEACPAPDRRDYLTDTAYDHAVMIYNNNGQKANFIRGMMKERASHTPVPRLTQEEVEKMAKEYASKGWQVNNTELLQTSEQAMYYIAIDDYTAGYNAAIQSQSAKVDDAQSQLEGDIAAFEKFEKECKELADTTAYAYYAFNEGLSHARSQSQSIQPTGSVREIAHEIYMNCFRIPDEMNYQEQTEDIAERIEKWLSSAAKNLPVQSIQLSDMFEAMVHGLLVSPGYYKCEKKDIDIEHWQKNFDKWVAWYMENKGHSPVADSRIEEMQKWLDTMPCWYDEDGTAQIDAEMVRDRFNQIFQ